MSNQPANVSTEIAVRIIETKPAVVSFNYQEISDHLDSVLANYRGLVFTESTVSECKKTIAELRKGQKSLDEFRKATKKQLTESVTQFENQCKTLYARFDDVIKPLTAQQDQFELDRREKKRAEIQSIIFSLIAEHLLSEKYASQLIILEEYFNKGKTLKTIKTELAALANTLKVQQDKEAQDIDLIKTKVQLANAQYQLLSELLTDTYLRFLAFHSVSNIEEMITSDAQKINEREKKAEEARLAEAAEVPKTVETVRVAAAEVPDPIVDPVLEDAPEEGKIINTLYEISGTEEQLAALEGWLDANDIGWTDRPELLDGESDDSFMY